MCSPSARLSIAQSMLKTTTVLLDGLYGRLLVVLASLCMCRDSYGMEVLLDMLGSPVTSSEKQVSVLNTLAHLARDLGNGNTMCRSACLLRLCRA